MCQSRFCSLALVSYSCRMCQAELNLHSLNTVLRYSQALVETAMFSACGGLAFALSSLLKLSSYEAFLMPLPILLCALRNGGSAGRKAVRSTGILLAGRCNHVLHPPPLCPLLSLR